MKFIFDVDGTLTPSRQRIDMGFAKFFMDFCDSNEVYIVTGSDRDKTIEQLGEDIYNMAVKVFNCSGNSVWKQDKLVFSRQWDVPSELIDFLIYKMRNTVFDDFAGKHFEFRQGTMNFSVVGRNADWLHRQKYIEHDVMFNERSNIANDINFLFPDLYASVGGETGIDIYPRGWDKSQILDMDFENPADFVFFGDKMEETGNDYPLAKRLTKYGGKAVAVADWRDTWNYLLDYYYDQ